VITISVSEGQTGKRPKLSSDRRIPKARQTEKEKEIMEVEKEKESATVPQPESAEHLPLPTENPEEVIIPIPSLPLQTSVMPVGEHEEEVMDPALAALPLLQKLRHKDWKVIQRGCEEIETEIKQNLHQDDLPFYEEVLPPLLALLKKSQIMVQESALCALASLLPSLPLALLKEGEGDFSLPLLKVITEKGIGGRTKMADASLSLLFSLTELGKGKETIEALYKSSTTSRNPKIVSSSLSSLCSLLLSFGLSPFPSLVLREITTLAPRWLSLRDPKARRGALGVLSALCAYIGEDHMGPCM
jgi:hypothetical protein